MESDPVAVAVTAPDEAPAVVEGTVGEPVDVEGDGTENVTEQPPVNGSPVNETGDAPPVISREPTPKQQKIYNVDPLEFTNAKSYLLNCSTATNMNLYDHLASMLSTLLDKKPANAAEKLEEMSMDLKRSMFRPRFDTILAREQKSSQVILAETQRDLYTPVDMGKEEYQEAVKQTGLFRRYGGGEEEEEAEADREPRERPPLPNLMELSFYFEQAGIGIGREETYRTWLAMRDLLRVEGLKYVRFWGKILGIESNYYVVECEYPEGVRPKDEAVEGKPAEEHPLIGEEEAEAEANDLDEEEEELAEDKPIQPDYKPPPVAPMEDFGTGANRKTYFVCTAPGKPWTRLPLVTPQQIQVARQIKKLLTGRLDAPVVSYPPFPGLESNYLRAQVARISAGTQVAPLNYYYFSEGEEEEAEEEGRDTYVENPEFEPIPVSELSDPAMSNWVHITQFILPQGRCKWWKPIQEEHEIEDEEDEAEEREELDEPEPEKGQPLLTTLSEDAPILEEQIPAWTTKISSNLIPQYALCVVKSNLWPGAYAFGVGRKFENIYIGHGVKYAPETYSPPPMPAPQDEFKDGPEITEIDDPTPEEEAALKAAQADMEEGGEEAEEEGEEEEDDDD